MHVVAGVILIALSMLCWGGQTIAWLAPDTAVRWSLMEAKDDVEPAYWGDIRGEAPWDALTLWTLAAAGVLLALEVSAWAYLGLVGGAMYVYFAGRGIFTRVAIRRRGLRVGRESGVRVAFVMLGVWGVMGLATIAAAWVELAA